MEVTVSQLFQIIGEMQAELVVTRAALAEATRQLQALQPKPEAQPETPKDPA